MPRPDIPQILRTLIDAAFGRARSKLGAEVLGYAKRFAALERLNAITHSVLEGEGTVPYLAELGLTPDGNPPEEMQAIIGLLEAVQALAEWQIHQPIGVNAETVREFFLRVGISSPWKAPAEIYFREGNVSPAAQRMIRRSPRFQNSHFGGQMMEITPILGGRANITAISGDQHSDTGKCPEGITFDPVRKIWDVAQR